MSEKYISASQQRVLRVFDVLLQSGINGARAGEVADNLRIARDKVTRDVANLVHGGWVEADAEREGVWRVTAKVSRMAFAVMRDLEAGRARMDEIERRYVGGCNG